MKTSDKQAAFRYLKEELGKLGYPLTRGTDINFALNRMVKLGGEFEVGVNTDWIWVGQPLEAWAFWINQAVNVVG